MQETYFIGEKIVLPDRSLEAAAEREDLISLLLSYRADKFISEVWIASIAAAACEGKAHLWRDLGLGSRAELSSMLFNAFPAFASLNTGDMRWKKFLYRHYCAKEKIYVCPAPSCEECFDYRRCFAPEV
jgi:nitrogen fixation protein NifQ